MLSKLIQEKIPIGSNVKFTLRNGESVSGILTEIGINHISLEQDGKKNTVICDMIGSWEIINKETQSVKEDLELETLKKLTEIEAQYEAKIQNLKIEPEEPDLILDSDEVLNYQKEIESSWNRIKNKYDYAKKINELSPVYGRTQQIINDLQTLIIKFPNLKAIKRIYAYLNYLIEKSNIAFKTYEEFIDENSTAQDWYNFGTFAIKLKKYEEACFALEQFFLSSSIVQYQNAWFVFIDLVRKFKNYRALQKIKDVKINLSLSEELNILFETGIYLLKKSDRENDARIFIKMLLNGKSEIQLLPELYQIFEDTPTNDYSEFTEEFQRKVFSRNKRVVSSRHRGYIYQYVPERAFGFLYDLDKNKYFFHKSAIIDKELLNEINRFQLGDRINVEFEIAEGLKGPVAVQISKPKSVEEIFKSAINYAEKGDYSYAISLIRRVLNIDPNFPQANYLYEKWREYARISGIPKGDNPYARAKRAQLIEKDLEKAKKFFNEAIIKGDNTESAIKDLAAILIQLNRPNEAVELIELNKHRIRNQESLDNLLINLYQNAKLYDNALSLLQKKLRKINTVDQKIQILGQIGSCYIKKEDYKEAIKFYNEILRIQPDNIPATRNIAICLMKQNLYDEAEKILTELVSRFPDSKSLELLEILRQSRESGTKSIEETLIETTLSDFSGELTDFAKFFLKSCDFKGVPPDKIQEGEDGSKDFIGSKDDALYAISGLKEIARKLGPGRPRDRSEYYLSAARIAQKLDDNINSFYRYLYLSFTSRGNASVAENKHIDTSREFYCEALNIYSAIRAKREIGERENYEEEIEHDAKFAFVRFLTSLLGHDNIPLSGSIPSIEGALEQVLNNHPNRDKAFELILYLMYRSRYAAKIILKNLYQKTSLQAMATDYLQRKGIILSLNFREQNFIELWNSQIAKFTDRIRTVSIELKYLKNIELTTSWLEDAIKRLREIQSKLIFDLDQQRVRQIIKILENCIDLCKQVAFEEKERLCIQISHQCENILNEIINSPTKISIEEMYPLVETYRDRINEYLDNLYESSVPKVNIQMLIETYIPDNNNTIELQITISNIAGRSPAESLELIIQEEPDLFTLEKDEIKIDESIRGGEQKTIKVPLKLNEEAIKAQTFSITLYAQYRTRKHEIKQTEIYNFAIRLYKEDDFDEIPNPYAPYAEGGAVTDASMFYGREELISNIVKALTSSHSKSKCIIIYGQKRAGKSSILYHLKNRLEERQFIVLDLGNIGGLLDPHSKVPLLYQILWSILYQLKSSISDLINEKFFPELNFEIPITNDFYSDPSPLLLFKKIFSDFKKAAKKTEKWQSINLVLMIDEFSYLYGEILSNRLSPTFMKNWKAILQENFFSAILAGQDVMPKFKQKFPNEFGTTQDERITYLKREDAEKLIDEPIRIGGKNGESRYRGKAIQRIIELTAGSPFYIQILCSRLVEYMNRKKANLITEADVEEIKNELISGVNSLTIDKFDNLINSGDTSEDAISDDDTLNVLKAIAKNSRNGLCHRDYINCQTSKPIHVILDDLVKRDVISCEQEHYYSIKVKLFEEWLKSNF